MNLDQHQIAIRARTTAALCDLAMLVVRRYPGQLLLLLAASAAPWILLNLAICLLLSSAVSADDGSTWTGWLVAGLTALESQAGTVLLTAWLGRVMFERQASPGLALRDTLAAARRLVWTQLILRPVAPLILCLAALASPMDEASRVLCLGLVAVLSFLTALVRYWRPFAVEIVVLERTPLVASRNRPDAVSYGRRSRSMHDFAVGHLVGSGLIQTAVLGLILFSLYALMMFMDQGLMIYAGRSEAGRMAYWTVTLWLTAGYGAVCRFLRYMDLRVRQEGWDAELLIRAEALRLVES